MSLQLACNQGDHCVVKNNQFVFVVHYTSKEIVAESTIVHTGLYFMFTGYLSTCKLALSLRPLTPACNKQIKRMESFSVNFTSTPKDSSYSRGNVHVKVPGLFFYTKWHNCTYCLSPAQQEPFLQLHMVPLNIAIYM